MDLSQRYCLMAVFNVTYGGHWKMRTPNKKLLLIVAFLSLEFVNTEVVYYTLCTTGTFHHNCSASYLFTSKIRFVKNLFNNNITRSHQVNRLSDSFDKVTGQMITMES